MGDDGVHDILYMIFISWLVSFYTFSDALGVIQVWQEGRIKEKRNGARGCAGLMYPRQTAVGLDRNSLRNADEQRRCIAPQHG